MQIPLLLFIIPFVSATHEHDHDYEAYFASTWIMTGFLLLFYLCIVIAAFPYTKPRIPIFAFFLLILLPPVFFFYIFYLFFILILLSPSNVQEETPSISQKRKVPQSRLEMSRV